jgi:hypothetical protein
MDVVIGVNGNRTVSRHRSSSRGPSDADITSVEDEMSKCIDSWQLWQQVAHKIDISDMSCPLKEQ